jgi:hypothetical protein
MIRKKFVGYKVLLNKKCYPIITYFCPLLIVIENGKMDQKPLFAGKATSRS